MNQENTGEVATGKAKLDVFEGLDPEIKIRTKKMMMWFIIFAVVMLFAGITSALIVLTGKSVWVHISPPTGLWISNVLIIASSLTLFGALRMLKSGKQKPALILTAATLALGIAFAFSQNAAWGQLAARGMGDKVYLNEQGLEAHRWNDLSKVTGEYGKDFWFEVNGEVLVYEGGEYYRPSNPAKPVTGAVKETFNACGALLYALIYIHIFHLAFGLIYLLVNTIRIAKRKLNAENWITLYTNGMYWHFMGILWLYLFAFIFFIF